MTPEHIHILLLIVFSLSFTPGLSHECVVNHLPNVTRTNTLGNMFQITIQSELSLSELRMRDAHSTGKISEWPKKELNITFCDKVGSDE